MSYTFYHYLVTQWMNNDFNINIINANIYDNK